MDYLFQMEDAAAADYRKRPNFVGGILMKALFLGSRSPSRARKSGSCSPPRYRQTARHEDEISPDLSSTCISLGQNEGWCPAFTKEVRLH